MSSRSFGVTPGGGGGGGGGDVPDATTTTKGIVRLAGDLSGTASTPTVPGLTTKAPTSRTISTTAPLTGGGDLSANRTLAVSDATTGAVGVVQLAGDLGGTATSPTVPGLTGKTPTSRAINTTAPLSGGGDLSADRTLTVSGATTGAVGVVQLAGDLAGTATAPTVPGLAGKAAAVHTHAESDVTSLVSDLAAKAPLASPALTGTPTAPTAAGGTNTTQVATTAFVTAAAASKVDAYTTQSKTADFTAAAGSLYLVDSTTGAVVATLPAANVAGQTVAVKWSAGSNTVTLQRSGSDTIGPSATSAVFGLASEVWEFVSSGAGQWNLVGGNKTLSSLDGRYPLRANDLSDLNSPSTARTNLGLGNSATRAVGTGTGTVLSPDTIDAKGDLLAGTAADTIARVPVGTNGQRLVADSTQTAGLGWATPDPAYGLPLIAGFYVAPAGTRSTLAMVQSVEYAVPVYFANAGTITRIGCEITTGGAGGTVVRLGIRAHTSGLPGSVLGETTVAGDAITASGIEATVSIVIPAAGIYWLTATSQGGSATVRSCTGSTGFAAGAPSLATVIGGTPNGGYITAATVTGTLPGSYTVSNRAGALPLVVVKI